MTDEYCPLCDSELKPYEPFDWLTCPNCDYVSSKEGDWMLGEKQIIYKIAEIIQQVAEEIKNINTDEELEEMEKQLEECKNLLRMMQRNDRTDPLDETDDDITYPSPNPNPPTNPYKPYNPNEYWTQPHTKQGGWDIVTDNNTSTSEKLESLKDILGQRTTND